MVKSPLPLTHYGLGPHRPQSHQNIARLNTEAEAYSKVIFAPRPWIKAQGRIHEYQISSPKGKVHLSKRGKWQGQKIIWQFSRMHQKKRACCRGQLERKLIILFYICVSTAVNVFPGKKGQFACVSGADRQQRPSVCISWVALCSTYNEGLLGIRSLCTFPNCASHRMSFSVLEETFLV